jgi:hypothetical protein
VVVKNLLLNGEGDGGVTSSALLCYQNKKITKLSLAILYTVTDAKNQPCPAGKIEN